MRFFGGHFDHGADHGDECRDRRHARGFFGREEGGGFGRHRGGGLGRLFAHGDLRHVVLYLIAEKPRHGYEIIKAIEELTGGAYSPSPGTVYPTLTLLEEQGLSTVETTEGNKKLHSITPEGAAQLEPHKPVVEAMLNHIRGESERRGGPSPRVVRAIENLRMALHMKWREGGLSEERIELIVEALDEATREIERA